MNVGTKVKLTETCLARYCACGADTLRGREATVEESFISHGFVNGKAVDTPELRIRFGDEHCTYIVSPNDCEEIVKTAEATE